MRLPSGLFAITVVIALLPPHRSEAAPIIFNDRATFQSYHALLGLPPLALETFAAPVWDINIAFDACTMHVPGLTIGHDCHDGGVDFFYALGIAPSQGYAAFPADRFSVGAGFDLPQTSIGFDYTTFGLVQFAFFDSLSSLSFILNGSGFLGIIDPSNPITSMGALGPASGQLIFTGTLQMDNLLLRVPEPATSLLLGSGIVLLQAARRLVKRRRSIT